VTLRARLARLVALVYLASALVPVTAAMASTSPVYDSTGNLIDTPFVPPAPAKTLTEDRVLSLALANGKIADWVHRYPADTITKDAYYDESSRSWKVMVWSSLPKAGEIVLARVDDVTGLVTEAWTGPQVAWTMARGARDAFGRKINHPEIWWPLAAAFLIGLANFRRPLSVRNLDLLVLLSFSISWIYFNEGRVFTSVPLAYPPLLYLIGRMAWFGFRRSRAGPEDPSSRPLWPVWLMAAATVFLAGFRIGLNIEASNVIDVGYAGVIGAERIVHDGQSPYGHFPTNSGADCGPQDSNGNVRDHIQTNGRCEGSNDRGDTYGPVNYIAYIPGYLAYGWSGHWDDLPAAHFTSLLFDNLTLIGLALVGWRFGRGRLATTLPFAWAAYPFTQYVSSSNSNDAILPCILVWGLWLISAAPARGLLVGLASWAKFSPLLLVPLWASYPDGLRRPRAVVLFALGFLLATALAFWVLLLEPNPLHAARAFWDRTFGFQLNRDSPFSLWNWGVYPGYPDLHVLQTALKGVVLALAVAVGFVPRRKTPLQLAALTALVLLGFELVLTHWFYLYIPWFVPFVAFAMFVPRPRQEPVPAVVEEEHAAPGLVGARA
jgi:hypothetical protein